MAAAAKVRYSDFIKNADKVGLPTKYLSEVAKKYTIEYGSEGSTVPTFSIMYLRQEAFDQADTLSPTKPAGEGQGILSIYHEPVHAWLDINQSEPRVAALISSGRNYYKGAPLANGKMADDETRLFTEAMATYTADRAFGWFLALEQLTIALEELGNQLAPAAISRAMDTATRAIKAYNAAMAQRVYGYQYEGSLYWKKQVYTTKSIMPEMKVFCDSVILEDKIPDDFMKSVILKQAWDSVAQRRLGNP